MKRFAALLLTACIVFVFASGCSRRSSFESDDAYIIEQNEEPTEDKPEPEADSTPPAQPTEFTNEYDGYVITIPADYTVNTELGEAVTSLESSDTIIEIFRQPLVDLTEEEYHNYTNGFLENTVDHTLDFKKVYRIGRRQCYVTAWHRTPMASIPSDKNYYISFDFKDYGALWCIHIKTTDPTQDPSRYKELIGSMDFYDGGKEPPEWKTERIEKEWNDETEQFYSTHFADDAPLTWGIFDKRAANGDITALNATEESLGYNFPIMLTYVGLYSAPDHNIRGILDTAWADGKVTELTLQTTPEADGSNMMYGILQGEYDESLIHYADVIREFAHPVLFRPLNEMNGDWCLYSAYHTSKDAGIYREVYRYIYRLFEKQEVDNAIWVWNPNERSFPDFAWNHPLLYYPGDEYVDIVGLTAYNTGNYYKESESWKSFTALYKGLYADYCRFFSQPLMITEFSCAAKGGNKRAWVQDMFEKLPYYGRIKVAVWWSHVDYDPEKGNIARDYRIDPVIDIFKEHLNE